MRKYYLFIIQADMIALYREKPELLFEILERLYRFNLKHQAKGMLLYQKFCGLFQVDVLSYYLQHKYDHAKSQNNRFLISEQNEMDLILLQKSAVILYTNCNLPQILKVFNWYQKRIFVCDFENQDYFWLSNLAHKLLPKFI